MQSKKEIELINRRIKVNIKDLRKLSLPFFLLMSGFISFRDHLELLYVSKTVNRNIMKFQKNLLDNIEIQKKYCEIIIPLKRMAILQRA